MPNDAKLGLLAGVIGVIAAAVLSANRPAPAPVPAVPTHASGPAAPRIEKPLRARDVVASTPSAQPADPPSTPIVRSRREADGTRAARTPADDIDP